MYIISWSFLLLLDLCNDYLRSFLDALQVAVVAECITCVYFLTWNSKIFFNINFFCPYPTDLEHYLSLSVSVYFGSCLCLLQCILFYKKNKTTTIKQVNATTFELIIFYYNLNSLSKWRHNFCKRSIWISWVAGSNQLPSNLVWAG